MANSKRKQDITAADEESFLIYVNEKPLNALPGESVLSTLLAADIRQLMKNDRGVCSGAYCGMGVCHCCHVKINGEHKRRACQTVVEPEMKVSTITNRIDGMGL